jgi:hypothetical protein
MKLKEKGSVYGTGTGIKIRYWIGIKIGTGSGLESHVTVIQDILPPMRFERMR